jgi:pimeloyl-ACP methyl ester carboxylesterase
MNRIIYLHGFASSPMSKKARFFAARFAARGLNIEVPDLAEGDFEHLTITRQLSVIERTARDEPVWLIGSSLGGYLAALYAARHTEVERLMLMAPAFNFVARWCERLGPDEMMRWKHTGKLAVEHYGDGLIHELHYGLIEDGSEYESYPNFQQPALIFHGRQDNVVPQEFSITFAQQHEKVELHLLDSGHELTNVFDAMWSQTERFFELTAT